jgi:hypothetical protein
VTSDLRGSWNERGRHWWRETKNVSSGAVSTNIVLIGSELSTLCGDTLQVLLRRSIGIANLEKESLFTNWLTVKLLDDLLADSASLETVVVCQSSLKIWK